MAQSLAKIYIHLIFSTSGRKPYLRDCALRAETWRYLAGVMKELECSAIEIGGTEDHVHVLHVLSRTRSIADVVKEVKRVSSLWVKSKDTALEEYHWQGGYGAFSVSQSNVERVRTYIRNQEEHHRTVSFQDEFRKFLRRYGMEWDERYVWD